MTVRLSRWLLPLGACAALAILSSSCAPHPERPPAAAESAPNRLGEAAEEVFDAAWDASWDKAETHRRNVHAASDELRHAPDAAASARVRDLVKALDAALARRDRLASLTAANELTRAALEMTTPARDGPPREIGLLDVEGRALRVAAEQGDLARARAVSGDIKRAWATVRPGVVSRGGTKEASEVDATVGALDGATAAAAFGALAHTLLDQVDLLEEVYARK